MGTVIVVLLVLYAVYRAGSYLRLLIWVRSQRTPKEKMEADILWTTWRHRKRGRR